MTLAPWAAQYVGLPYAPNGRTRAGVDCWGLVRLVLAEVFNVTVPSYAGAYDLAAGRPGWPAVSRILAVGLDAWRPVLPADARLGDGVVLRVAGHPLHVGIVAGVDPLVMLHVERGLDVCVERVASPVWARRLHGVYRCHA